MTAMQVKYKRFLFSNIGHCNINAGTIVGIGSANERRRYNVTPSLIGWPNTLNYPVNTA